MVLKNFFRTLPKWLLSGTLCLSFLAAQNNGHLSVGEIQKAVGKRNSAVQVKIPVAVDPGFHVNSDKPSLDYLIPLKLTWDKATMGALEGGTVVYPKASQEKYDFEEKPLSVFTGNFDLAVNFKVSGNAPAGPGIAAGKLRYQACSNKACYPPKTVDVNIPYQVQ
jgi:thiol:disulfide interchange protein DsbD